MANSGHRPPRVLAVDAAANYALGLPLLLAPDRTAQVLGLPATDTGFYARVLGGVLTGIATALDIERRRRDPDAPAGLGTVGAIAINTLGGGAVAVWLRSTGARELPFRGRAVLGAVATVVLGIGAAEAVGEVRAALRRPASRPPLRT